MNENKRRVRRGFTLLEMVIVVAIIAVLASVVAPNLTRHASNAKVQAVRSQLEMLSLALESFKLDTDRYPTTEEGLKVLNQAPEGVDEAKLWHGPYLKSDVPDDAWGNQYQYRFPAPQDSTTFELLSFGKDGRVGGDGENKDIILGTHSAKTR